VDQFAPLVILNELSDPIDADNLPPAAGSVRVTALALGDAVQSEVDGLLADREASLAEQRQVTAAAGVVLLIALVLALWLLLTLTRGRAAGPPVAMPERTPSVPVQDPDDRVPADLIDVRHLLDFEEMVELRRAVRARQPGSDDHAG
jgi:hypothetical protein